jgi:hypothetical protein
MHRRGERSVQDFGEKAQRKEITQKTDVYIGDGIKMDFGETGWEGLDWIHVAQDRD